ncbi:MAG: hypothetical protein ABJF10_28990 [Chthoniobacter sp.]|uniref:hypothetical protein n=1 Tax=Chthoniobacter sp. TaxID=2510640 RepID=UPI0032A5806A
MRTAVIDQRAQSQIKLLKKKDIGGLPHVSAGVSLRSAFDFAQDDNVFRPPGGQATPPQPKRALS